MNSFKIKEFKIWGLKGFEKFDNVNFELSDLDISKLEFPYITLIIGANATGKSRLLRILTEVFNDLYKLKLENNDTFSFKGGYRLEYQFKNKTFIVENNRHELEIKQNDRKIAISSLLIPNKLIAASYSITDRFPHQSNSYSNLRSGPSKSYVKTRYDNGLYEYLGVRTFNNMASASGHITRTIDLLFTSYINNNLNPSLKEVFLALKLKPQLSIEYRYKNFSSLLGREKLSRHYLETFIKNLDEKKTGFSYKYFKELLNNPALQNELIKYSETLKDRKKLSAPLIFDLDFTNFQSFSNFISEYRMLDLLRKLNLVGYGEVLVYREDGERFDINQGSSGEINIFTSLISLSCVIEDYSLILIDEPEISLHPNWQMKYLDLLNSIFRKRYSNCHFIICSHSHFLVSDLMADSSFILTLKNEKDSSLIATPMPRPTFGWSAEQILLEVFNVPTTRNLYVADLIGNILNLIAAPKKDLEEIKVEVQKIKEYNLDKLDASDPLKEVIEKIIKKYGKK